MMKRFSIWLFGVVFYISVFSISAEEKAVEKKEKLEEKSNTIENRKGKWSFQWGYNRSRYSQSDINLRGPGYHITFKDVVARDKPEPVSSVYITPGAFEVPQYNYKFTYYFKDNFFFSIGHDHMKYVISRGQASNIYGYIDPLAIQRMHLYPSQETLIYLILFPNNYQQVQGYNGGQSVNITPDILKFEHTDGLNFFYADLGFINSLWTSANGENGISLVGTVGAGPVVCRSDVRLFGQGKNNNFHFSGYGVFGSSGFRFDALKSFFIELTAKGGYIDLHDIYTTGRSKDSASQNFYFGEMVISAGKTFY